MRGGLWVAKADRPLTDKILLKRMEKLNEEYQKRFSILVAERFKELLGEIDEWTVENIAEKINSLWI